MPGSKVEKVTKAEAARRLGVSPRTIDRRIAAGQLRTEDVPVRGSRDKTPDVRGLGREDGAKSGAESNNRRRTGGGAGAHPVP